MIMIEQFLCYKNETFLDALQKININAKGVIFVIDKNKKLCGVLTDGDIRRALLDGYSLQELIVTVLKKDFVYVKKGEAYNEVIKKVSSEIHIFPIVDDNFKVVDYMEYRSDIRIPIVSLDLKGNEMKYLVEAFLSTWISSSGEYVGKFENAFSEYCGCKYGVTASNGTSALHLALMSLGIGKNDEVIIPDLTFAATINAVLHSGATPVIVDIENDSWCIDPQEIEKAISSRTKAIIPVHLYGQPCNMEAIMCIAKKHNLFVIEDCAEAHSATFDGKKVGSFGDVGCFSFFGNKIVTTGEGGMCVTNDEKLSARMKIFRDHGMDPKYKYWHNVVGYNYRMTNLQAAIGIAQLERIEELLQRRKAIEDLYKKELKDVDWLLPQSFDLKKRGRVVWLVSYLIDERKVERDILIKKMQKYGIETHSFFHPLSDMKIYKQFNKMETPVAHRISKRGINFPTNLNLSFENYQKVTFLIKSFQNNCT